MERPAGIVDFSPSPEYFPFESRWFESSVGPVHYIDEGAGRPLVLFHGNPDWSFLYRKMVVALRGRFRCIAMDYPGFGLSVHPDGYGYTPREHADVVAELVASLDLEDMIVMGQDWGGPIGMSVAGRYHQRVGGLVMGNTWYWPQAGLMGVFSRVMSSPPIQWLIVRRNIFVSPLMRRTLRTKPTDAEFEHYLAVVPTAESRRGIAEFPRQILAARPWLAEVEAAAEPLRSKPILLPWGMKDPAFGRDHFIRRWQEAFPQATLLKLPNASHYIQEDAPEEIVAAIIKQYG